MPKSVMQHQFARVPSAEIQRSSFNRSHGHKTTFNSSYLVPFLVDEVLPGDTFNAKATIFSRMNTPIFPILDNVFLDTFYFFVPNRLLWPNWQRFNGEQANPDDSVDFLMPQVTYTLLGPDDPSPGDDDPLALVDHFGLPIRALTGGGTMSVNALPFRAYNLIYNEWFRDENLQDSVPTPWTTLVGVTQPMLDGPDPVSNYVMKRRGKRHDYFTSCLPWPQKGPGVELPLGSVAPVLASPYSDAPFKDPGNDLVWYYRNTGSVVTSSTSSGGFLGFVSTTPGDPSTSQTTSPGPGPSVAPSNSILPALYADLSEATASTINELRQAFAIQRLYERDARGGTRYTEILRAHFGVISPDSRLQRPEYLGGGSQRLNVTTVAQTSSTDTQSPQGNLSAFAIFSDTTGFVHSFVEHGILIGMMMVRSDLTYQQGADRMWSRKTRFDHYWPALAHLGEQAVLSREIYADGSDDDELVFGYQERYAEYRYKPSKITGKFRSDDPQSLDAWHLSQKFPSRPVLNDSFIVEDSPFERVVAVPSEPEFIADIYVNMQCARPMPVYSVPGLIDHF